MDKVQTTQDSTISTILHLVGDNKDMRVKKYDICREVLERNNQGYDITLDEIEYLKVLCILREDDDEYICPY